MLDKGVFKKEDLFIVDDYGKKGNIFIFNENIYIDLIEIETDSIFIENVSFDYGYGFCHIDTISVYFDNGKFYIATKSQFKFKSIKINVAFSSVKFFSRKFSLLVAARNDGFGARFLPILNAMALSEITGMKFGFVWDSIKYIPSEDNLADASLPPIDYVFSDDFIDRYSYSDSLEWDRGLMGKISFERLKNGEYDNYWGWYISHQNLYELLGNCADFQSVLKKQWDKIEFSDNIKSIIHQADKIYENDLKSNFVAIHIRAGDIVFERLCNTTGVYYQKAMPATIAMLILEKLVSDDERAVIFTDDFTLASQIKSYFVNKNIYTINDLSRKLADDSCGRNIFEIYLMSKAKYIYAGDSSFSQTSSYIAFGKEPCFFYHQFNDRQIYDATEFYLNKINFHDKHKSFLFLNLAVYGLKNKVDTDKIKNHLLNALKYDEKNQLYLIGLIGLLIDKNLDECEEIAKKIDYNDSYLSESILVNVFYDNFMHKILCFSDTKYRYLYKFSLYCNVLHFDRPLKLQELFYKKYYYDIGNLLIENFKRKTNRIYIPFLPIKITKRLKMLHADIKKDIDFEPMIYFKNFDNPACLQKINRYKNLIKSGDMIFRANSVFFRSSYLKLLFAVIKMRMKYRRK